MNQLRRPKHNLTNRDDFFDHLFDGRNPLPWASINRPAVNVLEDEKSYKVEIIAPGQSKETFEIKIEHNTLIVSSENENSVEKNEKNYTRKEYSYASFSRSFNLPQNADKEAIQASYEDGVLNITIAKKETEEPTTKVVTIK